MKSRCKKIGSVLLCLTMLAGIAGCSQKTEEAPSDDTGAGGKEIVFWDAVWGGSDYTAAAKKLVEQYTEETGVNVVYQQIPWDNWLQTWSTAFASGTGPDVATGSALLQHRYYLSGDVAPLDDIASDFSAEDFTNGTWENFQYDGHQIAIPFNVDYRAIWYRKDLFDAAGITELPKNWEEFYETAKLLTHDDQYGYVIPGTNAMGSWTGLFWTINNGASFLNDDMKPDFTSDANIEAMDFLRKMYNEGIIPTGAAGFSPSDAVKLFMEGKAAMLMYEPGLKDSITSDELAEKIEILSPITSPAGIDVNVGSSNGIIMFSKAEERGVKQESEEFIKWWSENSEPLWTDGHMGAFPARLSLMDNSYFNDSKFNKLFVDLIVPNTVLYSYPHPSAAVEMDIMDGEQFYAAVIQELLTSDAPTEEIMGRANERYQESLDQLMSTVKE